MEQSVCMSLPDARPIAHLLLNSSVTARAAVVPRPNNKAPAKADVMFLRIGFVLGVAGWGSLSPLIYTLLFDRRVHAVARAGVGVRYEQWQLGDVARYSSSLIHSQYMRDVSIGFRGSDTRSLF